MPPRLIRRTAFPAYAYIPGRYPHPVRDQHGHSYGPKLEIDVIEAEWELIWGADLFDAGYYWEAHEAWEYFWHAADRGSAKRSVLKGLILLSAVGLKLREGKQISALRHANRAARNFQEVIQGNVAATPLRDTAHVLIGFLDDVDWQIPPIQPDLTATPILVFGFRVGSVLRRSASLLATAAEASEGAGGHTSKLTDAYFPCI